jgi:hypothetical protein
MGVLLNFRPSKSQMEKATRRSGRTPVEERRGPRKPHCASNYAFSSITRDAGGSTIHGRRNATTADAAARRDRTKAPGAPRSGQVVRARILPGKGPAGFPRRRAAVASTAGSYGEIMEIRDIHAGAAGGIEAAFGAARRAGTETVSGSTLSGSRPQRVACRRRRNRKLDCSEPPVPPRQARAPPRDRISTRESQDSRLRQRR